MKRRDFMKSGLATGAAGITSISAFANTFTPPEKHAFKMKYAPHFGMFESHAGKDLIDQLNFMADAGFVALEDNGMMKRPVEMQEKIGQTLQDRGMTMGVFVIDKGGNSQNSLTEGKQEYVDIFLDGCKKAVEVAKRTNTKWMTVVPGNYQRNIPIGIQTANVVEALRRAADIFEPHGLVMVLEPLSDTPDLFLRYSDQTYLICKAVNSPTCKILYDIYHMQKNEGHLIRNMDLTWDEIAYFQIGDNPGRKEPTTGEINYKNVFKHIYEKGYRGIMGMEHGNSMPGKEGELSLIKAYAEVDDFKV
ncbi:MAG: TIM barrel protein [Cyclobacteriaceae bacterium]